jgi:CheY-like chemotaxis protein
LVVDDEPDILDVIKQWLQLDGSTICTFTDPLAALEHFNFDPKDHHIVICDIKMPGMNGYALVKQIKKNNPKVKIILMTAFEIEDKELSRVLTDVKVDAFIKKPFLFESLKSKVQQQKLS